MTSTQSNVPGLLKPQISSYTPGAGNPRDSAIMANQNMNAKQASLNKLAGGCWSKSKRKQTRTNKKRHFRGGNNSTVVVPQMQMLYTPQNGANNPNDQIKQLSSTSMQSNANSVYDNQAAIKGGFRRKRGGNPNWKWGCYSGGRKSHKKHTKRRQMKHKKYKTKRRHVK
jgi:hypothetical protein